MGLPGLDGTARVGWACQGWMGLLRLDGLARVGWACQGWMGLPGLDGPARVGWDCQGWTGLPGLDGPARVGAGVEATQWRRCKARAEGVGRGVWHLEREEQHDHVAVVRVGERMHLDHRQQRRLLAPLDDRFVHRARPPRETRRAASS
eukprot:3178394-Prymnesium_polylepis.1